MKTINNLLLYSIFFVFLIYSFTYSQNVLDISAPQKVNFPEKENTLTIPIKVKINSPWHINSHKPNEDFLIPAELKIKENDNFELIKTEYPKPKNINFSFSEKPVSVFEGEITIKAIIKPKENIKKGNYIINFEFDYQACDNSTCLAPETKRINTEIIYPDKKQTYSSKVIESDSSIKMSQTLSQFDSAIVNTTNTKAVTEEKDFLFDESNLLYSLLIVFLMGFLLNLTPCVYPLIMITIGYFGNQTESKSSKLFLLSLFYVIGISITYSVIGVVTSLTGQLFGSALQNTYVILFIVLVLITLSLSMFGLYEINPPASLMNKVGGFRSGVLGALFMGLTMGIVAAPCVGPFVIGLVTFVGAKGDVFLGFLIFFILSLGLGSPYLVLGMLSGKIKSLPKSGEWMIGVKKLFGFILLSMAVYFALPLFPENIASYLLPAFTLLFSFYLLLFDSSGESSKIFLFIKKLLLIIVIAVSVWFIKPEQSLSSLSWIKPDKIDFYQTGKPAVMDFYADWCIPCKELDKITFSDLEVIKELSRFSLYKLDLTKSDNTLAVELTEKYKIKGVPTVIILGSDGTELVRITGFIPPEEFLQKIKGIK